jgi:hypothetical protein
MIVRFYDRQDPTNHLNGSAFEDADLLTSALHDMQKRPPFFCELDGENKYKLMIGLGNRWSCVQYSKKNGEPPYLMALAVSAKHDGDDLQFLINNTATPVPFRFGLSQNTLWQIVRVFCEAGERSGNVQWEEI